MINPVVVDISHYDNVTDWDAVVKFGILGVINKVTEGQMIIDRTYAFRRGAVLSHGLLYGAYHFLRPGDPVKQADFFLQQVKPDEQTLLALDYEDENVPAGSAETFLRRVSSQIGRKAVFYVGGAVRDKLPDQDDFLASHRLWHAEYNPTIRHLPPLWSTYWLWQYTGDGVGSLPHNVPGISISGGCDISTYAGSPAQLAKEWAS